MRELLKGLAVIVVVSSLALAAVVWGRTQGYRDASGVAVPTPITVEVHARPVDSAPAWSPPAAQQPTPSVTWSWDPKNPNQCVPASEQGVPPEVPRCKVPPDPGPPQPSCPPGTTLVYPNNQGECLPTSPSPTPKAR